MKKELTVGEMFSGPGGIGIAVNQAQHDKFCFKHLWATDIDKDTEKTYTHNVLKNSPDAKFYCEDIKNIDIDSLPKVDAFLFGFPCNDFSLIGERIGLKGKFGGLYTYGVKYINRVNPLFFMAENVTGLRSNNSGKALKKILHDLNHSGLYGYNLTVHKYKFEEYGVPQSRHRIIIIGIRGDLNQVFKVPKPQGRIVTCKEAIDAIPPNAPNNERTHQSQRVIARLKYIREGENVWQAERRMPKELRLNVKTARFSQIYRRLNSKLPAYTITGSGGGGTHVYHWSEPRALTNREKAAIQTFPHDFTFFGSHESIRKQIGMAVPCAAAKIILESVLKTLNNEHYDSIEPSLGFHNAKTLPDVIDI